MGVLITRVLLPDTTTNADHFVRGEGSDEEPADIAWFELEIATSRPSLYLHLYLLLNFTWLFLTISHRLQGHINAPPRQALHHAKCINDGYSGGASASLSLL